MVTRICFVCLGNIVRSPLAENLFRHHAERTGAADRYVVDSAGTSAWHLGERPDARMRRVAKRRGLVYDGRARQFKSSDLDEFDLIVAMDLENADDLHRMARTIDQSDKIQLMRAFDPQAGADLSVPDPYYGGIDGFEVVYEIVERSVLGLLEELKHSDLESKR
ncbi:MAG: low molecular weight protein-tyrosine-phosphatase [Chloroflexota bacterium]|nr:low molecular weight protein-tyrosine-phosphatase [Chloroflexota bacterium]